uniref:Uncharacterized protein n=1 Tax=Arundo donax TaxID=35708 RepID=A0A0A8YCS8_ARUDO
MHGCFILIPEHH